MSAPVKLSTRADQTGESPISVYIQQAVENPNLISLAAGLVDEPSLPVAEVRDALAELLADPASAREALQYGTTQGHGPLREKILCHLLALDGQATTDVGYNADDIVITTGSQQLLYLLGEVLFNPGDIVISEAPSYFVYHGILQSLGVRTLAVPMDEQGMRTDSLEVLLTRLEKSGELPRVRLIYTVDYFQNPTGLTLSLERRRQLLELARRFSKSQRILILEDAAYRELRFEGDDVPSIKSLDRGNEQVILAMTFSKPLSPGLKTGYAVLPREVMTPLLRFKGNHDFGSCNLSQHLLDRLLGSEAYVKHVERLREVYRNKRDVLMDGLSEEFGHGTDLHQSRTHGGAWWTAPSGGFYIWLRLPTDIDTGPGSRFAEAALREGVLYVPGVFCHVNDGTAPNHEARLCFGVASHDELREAARRLGRAARAAAPGAKITMRAFAGCR